MKKRRKVFKNIKDVFKRLIQISITYLVLNVMENSINPEIMSISIDIIALIF